MTVRRVLVLAHRWLGLVTAVVLSVVGATGAVLMLPDSMPVRRFAGPLHERLALGSVGSWVVIATTAVAVLLEFSGVILWWKRKQLAVRTSRGWARALDDLHHSAGVVTLPLALILAVTGLGLKMFGPEQPEIRRLIMALHTADPFVTPVKVLYVVATLTFLIQGVTGVVMWWKPWRSSWRGARGRLSVTADARSPR